MRLYVLSDLHLESDRTWRFPDDVGDFDVAVFAGDVDGSVRRSVEALRDAPVLKGKPVVLVAGNHEHYGSVFQDNLEDGLAAAQGTNVHLMDRATLVIEGVRFIGATLWTDYALLGTTRASMVLAGREMNDHALIRYREAGGHVSRFMPWHARAEHRGDLAYLRESLSEPHDGKTVVVTHHLPSPSSIGMRFQNSPLNPAFASDLDALILAKAPSLWIHGHTHSTCDYRLGETRVLCNPLGYRTFGRPLENGAFDAKLIVET